MKAAVYAGTRNIYKDMLPSMKSLLRYSDVNKIYFLIEDDEFPYELPPEVECINVSNQKWFDSEGPNYICQWSHMILLRAALAQLFPHLDRILSLDCDTIVRDNISDLWDLPLDGYYFAGVHEPKKSSETFRYINAGVLMFNLKKIREDHKDEEYIYNLNNCFRYFPEQECFSALSQGQILELPSKYNLSSVSLPSTEEKIIHFAAYKQWPTLKLVSEYRDMPLDFERNQYNTIELNKTHMLFIPPGAIIPQENIDLIVNLIKQNPIGYMYLWGENCLVLKTEYIERYDIDTHLSVHGLICLSQTILSYLQQIEACKRVFTFRENIIIYTEDFPSLVKNTIKDYYYLLKKCKSLKIPTPYIIRELNYRIVWIYWLFLRTIHEYPELRETNWHYMKEFYNNCYSKYELIGSQTLAEPYYKYNTQLILPHMREWKTHLNININRFLQDLKTNENLPERYKI